MLKGISHLDCLQMNQQMAAILHHEASFYTNLQHVPACKPCVLTYTETEHAYSAIVLLFSTAFCSCMHAVHMQLVY